MKTELQYPDVTTVATPLLVVFAVQDVVDENVRTDPPAVTLLLSWSDAVSASASRFLNVGEFKAGVGDVLLLHAPAGLSADRLLVVGLGKAKALTPTRVRDGAGTAVRAAMNRGLRELAVVLPLGDTASTAGLQPCPVAQAVVEGLLLGAVDLDVYKTDRKDRTPDRVVVLGHERASADERTALSEAFTAGIALADAQNFARDLVNEPGNILTPTELGRRTAAMAQRTGLQCEVHSTDKLKELKMGAFLGVAQGSEQPPALIVLRYDPPVVPPAGCPRVGLVGKGITFDTGGISIKPADGMDKMKNDMGGAAAMIGAMQAIAALKPAIPVFAVICSAENMPDGNAYRPGDVLTAMSGKTIEIMNTDAEGRLVLADGLHYATTLGATHLIDAATLTGACVVALGRLNAGLFSNDEAVCDQFLTAMRTTGEGFWRLPCTDDYQPLIKSQIADIQNTGVDKWGGAITAAMFLKEFVGNTPWIHLDIAGQAVIDDLRPHLAKGASGFAVRSIVEWVQAFTPATAS